MSTEAGNSPPLSYNSVDVDVRISQRTNGRDVIVFSFLFFGVGLNFRSNSSQPHFAPSTHTPLLSTTCWGCLFRFRSSFIFVLYINQVSNRHGYNMPQDTPSAKVELPCKLQS